MGTLFTFALVILFYSDAAFGGYCTSYRTEYKKTYRHCQLWGWGRCTTYRPYTVPTQVCCPGWKGASCSIPICNEPCVNGGTCIGPNMCKCPSSFSGSRCSITLTFLTTQTLTPTTTTAITQTKSTHPLVTTSRTPWVISGNETSDCVPEVKDIFFLVDGSTRLGEKNFLKVKTFIKQTVGTFDIGFNQTRVGVILFNTNASLVFSLDEYNTSENIQNAVDNITYTPANETNIAQALEFARTQGFTYDRVGAPNIAFVITDGYSSNKTATQLQATLAKKDHLIQIVTTAVGQYVDFDELVDIASENPYTNRSLFYSVDDFDDLHVRSLENVLTSVICGFQILPTSPEMINSTTQSSIVTPCYNKVKNCDEYQHDMCTSYRPWALAHCNLYCGFCQGPTTPEQPCLDTIGNCHEYGPYICNSTTFRKWTKDHCSQFCGLCGPNKTIIETPPTPKVEGTMLQAKTPLPTSSSSQNSSCFDKVNNCDLYSQDMCSNYRPWAMEHCQLFCRFCTGTATSIEQCVDTVSNCDEYGTDMCTAMVYRAWTKHHCPQFCGLCESSSTHTPCVDKIDNCNDIVPDICTSATNQTLAKENCAKFCNMCGN